MSAKYSFNHILGAGSALKLRAAYGELGNLPNFGDKFTVLGTPQFGAQNGFQVGTIAGASSIEPERVKEVEGGFDLNFWSGRANLDVSAYDRRTTNLLLRRTPAPSTGYTGETFNGGEIRNRGIEVILGVTPAQQRNFTWVSNTSFTFHRSKVLSLPVPPFRPPGSGFGGLGVLFIDIRRGHRRSPTGYSPGTGREAPGGQVDIW